MAGALLVRDIMTKPVKTARPDSSVAEVVRKMNKFGIGSIVVVERGQPVGVITERDILSKVVEPCIDPRNIRAKDVMSSPVITIREDATVEEAAELMAKRGVKKLPVVNNGKLVGIVTSTDIVRNAPSLLELIKEMVWIRG